MTDDQATGAAVMGDDQEFLDRLKELQLRLIYEQKTTDAITVTMAMARIAALAGPMEREGWVLVGSVASAHGDPEAFGERRVEITADLMKLPYDTPLYALLSAAPKPEAAG